MAGELPDEDDATPLAAWVRSRIGGHDAAVPDGLEGEAATVLAYAAEYPEGDDGRVTARTAVENLRVGRRITEIDDELASLKAQRDSPDNNQDTLKRLAELQRERVELEREFRASAL